MRIGIIGLSDKRHVIYTLIRVLGGLSSTVVFTPNKQYLYMSEDFVNDFELNDIRMVVCDDDDLDSLDEEEFDFEGFEYIVYDILTEIPSKLDVAVIMDHRDKYTSELENLELEDIPIYSIGEFSAADAFSSEKKIKLTPASAVEPVLQEMYKTRQIKPFKNSGFNKSMCTLVCEVTGLPSRVVLSRINKGVIDL